MRRVLVFAVLLSLVNSSMAFAGETLLASATRVVRDAVQTQPAKPKTVAVRAFEQAPPAVSSSGMRKRTKTLIFLAAAIGFAASAYAIDHEVKDVTPSTLGTRED